MNYKLINILFSLIAIIGLSACKDEMFLDRNGIGEGEARITAEVTFTPLISGLSSRSVSGGTPGDAIKKIDNLWVIIYDENNNFVSKHHIQNPTITSNDKIPDDALNDPTLKPEDYGHQAESTTDKASFTIEGIPFGRYYMYAVANTEEINNITDEDIATPEKLKQISLKWDENKIPANNQMFGYFTLASETDKSAGFDADLVTIDRADVKLHAWIKRAASKVTIAFDARKLKDNITIYLKTAEIKDIPAYCFLGQENKPGSYTDAEWKKMNELIANGQTIDYVDNPISTNYDQTWTARISNGTPIYGFNTEALGVGDFDEQIAAQHGENVNALYFYENMQGKGTAGEASDKWQVVEGSTDQTKPSYPDGNTKPDGTPATDPSDTGFKDDKVYGTYIEVKAFYRSNNTGDMTSGDIIYRFMLGRDTHLDFDAMRNHHYKLTLRFNGYANDVDWHIVYDREPGIKAPNPYYISYLYNHSMMFPIQIDTEPDVIVNGLKVDIVENSWAPNGAPKTEYWWQADRPNDYTADHSDGYPWNGFLSLHKTTKTIYFKAAPWNLAANKEYYYEAPSRAARTYFAEGSDIKTGSYSTTGAVESDKFNVDVTSDASGNIYKFQLPMYTRAKQLIKQTAYTGNNPYVAYQRNAKVRVTASLYNTKTKQQIDPYVSDLTIKQVRRIVNPKGIWRSASNNTSFNAVMKILPNEESTSFTPLESDGPWKAYVLLDQNGIIKDLTSDAGTTSYKDEEVTYEPRPNVPKTVSVRSLYGGSTSIIDFDVNFNAGATGDAVIRVEYNNFSCYHLIFVKKGDDPVDLGTGTQWYTRNMRSSSELASNPLDEGSLFKWSNWTGIDALKNKNNVSDKNGYWTNVMPDNFIGNAADPDNLLTLDEWNAITHKDNSVEANKTFPSPSLANADIATYQDFVALYKSDEIEQGYGVLYGDESDGTLNDINQVYGYDYENKTGGMRGCFVYNKETGHNVFFPIGASGYGHRRSTLRRPNTGVTVNWNAGPYSAKNPVTPASNVELKNDNSKEYQGVLRYSCNPRWGWFNIPWGHGSYPQAVNDAPLFFDLYRRPGAIYWVKQEVNGRIDTETYPEFDTSDLNRVTGWDFNYFTFDFFPIGETNMNNGADAIFIRCVQR